MTDLDKHLFFLPATMTLKSHCREAQNPESLTQEASMNVWQLSQTGVISSLGRRD